MGSTHSTAQSLLTYRIPVTVGDAPIEANTQAESQPPVPPAHQLTSMRFTCTKGKQAAQKGGLLSGRECCKGH